MNRLSVSLIIVVSFVCSFFSLVDEEAEEERGVAEEKMMSGDE